MKLLDASPNTSRVHNSARNTIAGFAKNLIMIGLPFVVRTMVIYIIGEEYLGLNSFFTTILSIINLSELGIGRIMGYFLYKPIAENNTIKINAYLNTLKKIYACIGGGVLLTGMAILPFLPRIITASCPKDVNLYLLFFMYLIASAAGYFEFGFAPALGVLFHATQRSDIDSVIWIITSIVVYGMEIAALAIFKSFYVFVLISFFQTFLIGFYRRRVVKKLYPNYIFQGKIDKDEKKNIIKQVIAMFGLTADAKLLNGIDTVFITSFIGLKAVAVYGNYFYIVTAVEMFLNMIYSAISASIGNAIATETKEGNYYRFKCVFFLNAWLAGWAMTSMLCLYQGFMTIWMGTDRMLGIKAVVCFCLYFYLSQIRNTVLTFKDANGMWWNDKFKPYVSLLVDIVLDILLIPRIGISGAVIASIVSIAIIELPWETRVLFREYFNNSICEYMGNILCWMLATGLISVISYCICERIAFNYGIVNLFMRMLVCMIIPNVAFFALFSRRPEYKTWKEEITNLKVSVFKKRDTFC